MSAARPTLTNVLAGCLRSSVALLFSCFFFFNDTATTEIYTLSLHDALPIYRGPPLPLHRRGAGGEGRAKLRVTREKRQDRKSTRLNSSHGYISYAVFCLKKKKTTTSKRYSEVAGDHHTRDEGKPHDL